MSINLHNEDLLSLADAAKKLPAFNGKHVHTSTLWRWCITGVRGIRLEHVRVGARICTSVQALSRFMNRLAEAHETPSDCQNDGSSSEDEKSRLKVADDACAALDTEGFNR